MRDLAQRLRGQMRESCDSYYCRLFQTAAMELEDAADALDRTVRLPPLHLIPNPRLN